MPDRSPLRLAFLGRRGTFESRALQDAADGVQPAFLDLRHGTPADALRRGLEAIAPDVVVAFEPELLPDGALDGTGAALIGPDALPPAVSDRLFAAVREPEGRPRVVFVGRSTERRERLLIPLKHDYDVLHVAHGVSGDALRDVLAAATIAINVHAGDEPAFEHRVALSLAAGLLVLSEPLQPDHGLIAGVDYVESIEPWEMWEIVARTIRTPHAFRAMRLSGRRQAERFRASRVYPRLAREVLAA